MITAMENAASMPSGLPRSGESAVGTVVNVRHLAATRRPRRHRERR